MKLDLIVLGITLIFVLGGAYLGAMRSLMKILSFFGSAWEAVQNPQDWESSDYGIWETALVPMAGSYYDTIDYYFNQS